MTPLEKRLEKSLEALRELDQRRQRRVVHGGHGVAISVDGRSCINFCSNDYLGLAADARIARAAQQALDRCGTGSGAAALVSGYNAEHRRLEEALAEFVQRPRVLLFSSGWAANLGVLRALLGRGDTLVADELNHASLIDGGRLSGANYHRVPHGDLAGFARALAGAQGESVLATDAVFSMDGDIAPMPELSALCEQHGAALMVDDAHGFGVFGANGRGTPEFIGITPEVYVATLGKALGVTGAFVAGSENLVEFLINRARSWVFSTAPPPAMAAAARESLRLVQTEPQRREQLFERVRQFREGARQRGLSLSASQSPIQPMIVGDESRALALSSVLHEAGYWVAAIRPPTVPPGTSRLRITLSAAHSAAQVDGLLDALSRAHADLGRGALGAAA